MLLGPALIIQANKSKPKPIPFMILSEDWKFPKPGKAKRVIRDESSCRNVLCTAPDERREVPYSTRWTTREGIEFKQVSCYRTSHFGYRLTDKQAAMSTGGRKDCHGLNCLEVVLLSLERKNGRNHHNMHLNCEFTLSSTLLIMGLIKSQLSLTV